MLILRENCRNGSGSTAIAGPIELFWNIKNACMDCLAAVSVAAMILKAKINPLHLKKAQGIGRVKVGKPTSNGGQPPPFKPLPETNFIKYFLTIQYQSLLRGVKIKRVSWGKKRGENNQNNGYGLLPEPHIEAVNFTICTAGQHNAFIHLKSPNK